MEDTKRRNRSRAHTRYPVIVRVTRYGDTVDEWCTVNLSEGGLYVEAVAPLVRGARAELGIHIDTGKELHCSTRVVWRNDADDPNYDPNFPAGMGLEFVDLSEHDRLTLREFLNSLDDPMDAAVVEAATGRRASGPVTGRRNSASNHTTEAETHLLATGTVLGSYRILGILGQGGMGTVYLSEHVRLGREVALKRLHPKFTHDVDAAARFFDEARLVNQIHHEHITEITDFITDGDDHYFVMELLNGTPLSEVIEHHGKLPLARAVHIGLQLCDVLEAVHAKDIIHRDLKPENILLVERDDDPDFVKLVDFGIAKLRESADHTEIKRKTAVGTVVGTPGYMAPEIVLGSDNIDHRVDVYGFGVVFYQMVVGHLPFQAEEFDALIVKQATELPPSPKEAVKLPVPPEVEELILRCLDGNPENRPYGVDEIAQVLREVESALWATDDDPSSLDEIEIADPGMPEKSGSRAWVVVLLLVLAATAVAGVLFGPQLLAKMKKPAVVKPLPPNKPTTSPKPEPEPEPAVAIAPEPEPEVEPEPDKKGKKKKRRKRRRGKSTAADPPAADGAHFERGMALLRERKAVLAAQELEQAIAAAPNHAEAFRALGKAYVLLGREKAAVKQFERYLALKPGAKDADKLRNMIRMYQNQ